ncbi:MAG TPA: prepilin-type N-terminal cleavage/methylation domain-containing protein [Opitutaceae bacterium]
MARKRTGAFTLIELLVVVIIVAVLAAVGLPLLSGNVERAKATEADAGLGTIRTQLRAMRAELGSYPVLSGTDPTTMDIGLIDGDLDGKWFTDAAYSINSSAGGFWVCVDGAASESSRVEEVENIQRSMDHNGEFGDGSQCST